MGGETDTQITVCVDVSMEERIPRKGCSSDRRPGAPWVPCPPPVEADSARWTWRNGMEALVDPLASSGFMRGGREGLEPRPVWGAVLELLGPRELFDRGSYDAWRRWLVLRGRMDAHGMTL
jgi:hypothetical protein